MTESQAIVQTIDLNFELADVLYSDVLKFLEYAEESEKAEPKTPLEETIRQLYKKNALKAVLPASHTLFTIPYSGEDNTLSDIYNYALGAVMNQIESYKPSIDIKEYSINVGDDVFVLSLDQALIQLGITSFSFDTCIEATHINSVLSQVEPKGIKKKYLLNKQKMLSIYAVLVRRVNEPLEDSPEKFKAFINERCAMFEKVLTWKDVKDIHAFFLTIWEVYGRKKSTNSYLMHYLKYIREKQRVKH